MFRRGPSNRNNRRERGAPSPLSAISAGVSEDRFLSDETGSLQTLLPSASRAQKA